MKNLLRLVLITAAAAVAVCGQKTFEVRDFSGDFYGKVHLAKQSEVFSPGWVAIYDKRTKRQLLKLASEALVAEPDQEGKVKANVRELPYGEQSVIIHEDFNFDGVKDFALMDGQNSCYGGPSFQIYLAAGARAKSKFVLSRPFTRLAQDYCGMFEVDRKKKMISTMTKSGCCWHQYSEFVVGNKPKAVKIVEEDLRHYPFVLTTEERWNGKSKVMTTARTADFSGRDDGVEVLLSFKTRRGEEVILFKNDGGLNYAFVGRSGNVGFAYPLDSKQENPTFSLDSRENPSTLSFTNNDVLYKIYEAAGGKIGVEVEAGGRKSEMAGVFSSRKGSLRKIAGDDLHNVILKK